MAALASLLQANNEESSNGAEYGSYSDANATDTEAILSTILHMNKGKPHVSASDQSSLFNHYFSIAMRQQQQGLDILNNLGESGGLNVGASGTQDSISASVAASTRRAAIRRAPPCTTRCAAASSVSGPSPAAARAARTARIAPA